MHSVVQIMFPNHLPFLILYSEKNLTKIKHVYDLTIPKMSLLQRYIFVSFYAIRLKFELSWQYQLDTHTRTHTHRRTWTFKPFWIISKNYLFEAYTFEKLRCSEKQQLASNYLFSRPILSAFGQFYSSHLCPRCFQSTALQYFRGLKMN